MPAVDWLSLASPADPHAAAAHRNPPTRAVLKPGCNKAWPSYATGKKLRPQSCTPWIRGAPQTRPREVLAPPPSPGAPWRDWARAVGDLQIPRRTPARDRKSVV